MKFVKPQVTKIYCTGLNGILNVIQKAAKICYASEKLSDELLEICRFIDRLISLGHFSPLEHGLFWVDTRRVNTHIEDPFNWFVKEILDNVEQARHFWVSNSNPYIIGINARTFAHNFDQQGQFVNFTQFYNYIKDKYYEYFLDIKDVPFELHPFSYEIWTTSKALKQLNRHFEEMGKCEQSTRFCNFNTSKFDNEVSYLYPYWWEDKNESSEKRTHYWNSCQRNEEDYLAATKRDSKGNCLMSTDEASSILNSGILSKGVYTASVREWNHIREARVNGLTGKPHGDIKKAISLIFENPDW